MWGGWICFCLLLRDKTRVLIEDLYLSVGVMKDEKDKTEGSARLTYTGLRGGLEHLKIETRLIDERFASVMGECVILTL